jgi:hypothetical protein
MAALGNSFESLSIEDVLLSSTFTWLHRVGWQQPMSLQCHRHQAP